MKNLLTLLIFLLPVVVSGQDIRFSFDVINNNGGSADVRIFMEKSGSGSENVASYTVVFYYDNTETTLNAWDFSPTTALGWNVFESHSDHVGNNNGMIPCTHTGYAEANVIDQDLNGTDVADVDGPLHILTINFNHAVGDPNQGGDGCIAATADDHPALEYSGVDLAPHAVIITGAVQQGLPIILGKFDAFTKNNIDSELQWESISEINSSHFEIERSRDGKKWSKVGYVTAAGFSEKTLEYQFIDENAVNHVNFNKNLFYRLKMVDLNGTHEYSDIKNVQFEGNRSAIKVYPNPTFSTVNISFDGLGMIENGIVEIRDVSSRTVFVQSVDFSKTRSQKLEMKNLGIGQGVYFIRVRADEEILSTQKLIVVD